MPSRRLEIVIAGDPRGAVGAMDKIEKKSRGFSQKLSSVGNKLTAGVTLPLAAAMVVAGKAAADEEQEMASLAKTLHRNLGLTQEQIDAQEEWITAVQNTTAVADSDLRPALAKLSIATGDITKAQGLLNVALDVSAARHRSLKSVVDSLVKAQNGQTAGLSRLGVKTKDAGGNALRFGTIIGELTEKMGGSAVAAADTTAGRMEILKLKFGDLQEKIGTAVLPIMNKLATQLSKVADWFTNLTDSQQDMIVKTGLLVAALGPLIKAFDALKFSVGGVNAAFLLLWANPVIAGFLIGIGLITILYTKFESFRKLCWKVLFVTAEFFNLIRNKAVHDVQTLQHAMHDVIGAVGAFINAVKSAYHWLAKLLDKLPGGGGKGFNWGDLLPNIPLPGIPGGIPFPGRAAGGPVSAGRGYVVGERGPEWFIPKSSGTVMPNGGLTQVFHINGVTDHQRLGNELGRKMLWGLGRVNGSG